MLFITLAVRAFLLALTALVLATRGVIMVTQTEPYGEINLKMAI